APVRALPAAAEHGADGGGAAALPGGGAGALSPWRALARPRPALHHERASGSRPAMAAPTVTNSSGRARLLERSEQLDALEQSLAAVGAESAGRLVLVRGEAGVGKTVLLRRFCEDHEHAARVLSGGCDALFTPRPLGPLLDVAATAGGELEALVGAGGRPHEVAAALMLELH